MSAQPDSITSIATTSSKAEEREADIEDGWGDDTWGEPESAGTGGGLATDDLAANLRLSVDREAGGDTSIHSSAQGTPIRQIISRSPSHEAMEYKMAEKESELESLQDRYDKLVEAKGELENHIKDVSNENSVLHDKLGEIASTEETLKASLEESHEKINILEEERKIHAKEIEDENDELRKLREEVEKFKEMQMEISEIKVQTFV